MKKIGIITKVNGRIIVKKNKWLKQKKKSCKIKANYEVC
jgi:hypothetical protein